jgi:hypothetical protein
MHAMRFATICHEVVKVGCRGSQSARPGLERFSTRIDQIARPIFLNWRIFFRAAGICLAGKRAQASSPAGHVRKP